MPRIRQDIFLLWVATYFLSVNSFHTVPNARRSAPAFVTKPIFALQATKAAAGEAESIFQSSCDQDGLMTKEALTKLEFVSELLVRCFILSNDWPRMITTCSRITPRQCRRNVSVVEAFRMNTLFAVMTKEVT